jgi:hypothetical protein
MSRAGLTNTVNTVEASLKADTSAEVISMGNECSGVVGLEDGTILDFGSTCLTTEGDFGMLTSNGVWKF